MLLLVHFLHVICRFSRLADEAKRIVRLDACLRFWEIEPEESAVLTFVMDVYSHLVKPHGTGMTTCYNQGGKYDRVFVLDADFCYLKLKSYFASINKGPF